MKSENMDQEKESETNILKISKNMGIPDPEQRLKALSDYGTAIDIDVNIPPRRYYRSGVEMLRMANVYMKEGSFENAFTLYMKFLTIFLEKIRTHPHFNTVPLKDRAMIQQALRDVMPKAESLKKHLLEQYKAEATIYLEHCKAKQKLAEEREKLEEECRLKEEENRKNKLAAWAIGKDGKGTLSIPVVPNTTDDKLKPQIAIPAPQIPSQKDNTAKTSRDKDTPVVDRSTKPSLFHGDKLALRDVILPNMLMQEFLKLALSNTIKNKETCGILAGRLERNQLLVTHLLIPQQTGSPDSCATHNEEDIFDYQDQHSLITLGWVHTHPTQTAFLSSVDLHTHCSYQLMMAEAIAIVCAPKYRETGFFTLTPEYGLNFIANCRETGFHPHPTEPALYTNAKHCKVDGSALIEVVDLRK
ncbi:STAM-binding protein-like A [Cephus cinctus]|uniref:STAM-binding protein-like A n=1 Tax=Cephus cinctus TaxID=211228 RepID=A0AAJ7FSX1_CEPCN|nr:STAM-binding protein-like A [Cephus cinctus]